MKFVNAMVLTPRMVRVFQHEHGCSVQKEAFLSRQIDHLLTLLTLYNPAAEADSQDSRGLF
jgi:hypothetical protein